MSYFCSFLRAVNLHITSYVTWYGNNEQNLWKRKTKVEYGENHSSLVPQCGLPFSRRRLSSVSILARKYVCAHVLFLQLRMGCGYSVARFASKILQRATYLGGRSYIPLQTCPFRVAIYPGPVEDGRWRQDRRPQAGGWRRQQVHHHKEEKQRIDQQWRRRVSEEGFRQHPRLGKTRAFQQKGKTASEARYVFFRCCILSLFFSRPFQVNLLLIQRSTRLISTFAITSKVVVLGKTKILRHTFAFLLSSQISYG